MQDDDIVFEEGEDQAPEEKLKALRTKLKECQSEKDEYLTGWQRAKADLVNARKSADAEIADKAREANRSLILELLPILDSFEMAMKGAQWASVDETWRSGVEGIYGQLISVMTRFGAEGFDPKGEEFNPHEHEPLRMVPYEAGLSPHTVSETYQRGYKLNGKIIRPAKVAVIEDPPDQ